MISASPRRPLFDPDRVERDEASSLGATPSSFDAKLKLLEEEKKKLIEQKANITESR